MHKRKFLTAFAMAAAAMGIQGVAWAAGEWPQRAVRMVVPFPPGGGTDATSRLVADKLNLSMGWTVVVDNKPGAGGNIGLDAVAKAAPDGYTIGMGQAANLAINPSLYAKMPFDPLKDFTPIVSVALQPVVLTVRADSPFKNLGDFIKAAKAKPGAYGIAQAGNGVAAYVDSLDEARRLFGPAFDRGAFPIADDVKIQVEFNPATVTEYRLIGYETRLLAREDFNNDQVDAGEVGSGASVTALYEITPAGAPASSDPLRYGPRKPSAPAPAGELAYLKIRYKLPGQTTSKLIERPIGGRDIYPSVQSAPDAARWALSVAAFGQKLRGNDQTASFGYDRILEIATAARGADPCGDRAEFLSLVRLASALDSANR